MGFKAYNTDCPRCGRKDEIILEYWDNIKSPEVKCGDCLWLNCEITSLNLTAKGGNPVLYDRDNATGDFNNPANWKEVK